MRYRIVFATGVAVGYVAGARAGRERYDALARRARSLAERPEIQEAAGLLQAQLSQTVRGLRDLVAPVLASAGLGSGPTAGGAPEGRRGGGSGAPGASEGYPGHNGHLPG